MTKVRSIGVFSAAKIYGLFNGILGLLIAPLVLLGPGLAILGADGNKRSGFGEAIVAAVMVPIFSAVVGFIGGAVMAFIYNAISQAIGGLEVELESAPPAIVNAPQVSPPPMVFPPTSNLPPPSPPEFG
jgi:hypothetical protein